MAVAGTNPKTMAEGDTLTGTFIITKIRVVGMTTAGHLANFLRNGVGGEQLSKIQADAANFTDEDYFPGESESGRPGITVDDLHCDDLDSGTAYVHHA